jgi:tRNA-modifying protein YgfZ
VTDLIPLPYLTACRVVGADAGAFLHGQLAADIASLATGEACFAACCSARGQVIGLLLVHRGATGWLVAGARTLIPGMIARLKRYVLRSRVEFHEQTHVLAGVVQDAPPNGGEALIRPHGTALRYTLVEPAPDAPDPAGWRRTEVRCGVLWLQPETSERFIPQMLGLERIGAVSFNKGCYPGQEIIARARYLGRVKRRPLWLEFTAPQAPQVGTECRLETGSGHADAVVVEAVGGPGDTWLAVLVAAPEEGATVEAIDTGAGRVPVRQLPAPGD